MSSEQEFSGEQSRQIAALIREEIARRRMSRQQLADKAKLSLSTLEKVLGGRRPLTLATAVRVEEALGGSLRRSAPEADAPLKDGVAPDGLGARIRGAAWLGWKASTLPSGPPLATKARSTPIAPKFSGTRRPHAWCFARRNAWTPSSRNMAKSRCRTSRVTSFSSPTVTVSIG